MSLCSETLKELFHVPHPDEDGTVLVHAHVDHYALAIYLPDLFIPSYLPDMTETA